MHAGCEIEVSHLRRVCACRRQLHACCISSAWFVYECVAWLAWETLFPIYETGAGVPRRPLRLTTEFPRDCFLRCDCTRTTPETCVLQHWEQERFWVGFLHHLGPEGSARASRRTALPAARPQNGHKRPAGSSRAPAGKPSARPQTFRKATG